MDFRMLAIAGLVVVSMVGCDGEVWHHHQPGHAGGPPGLVDDEPADPDPAGCQQSDECPPGKGCTQGGQCIDVTGTTSVLTELQAELDALPNSVGMGGAL